MSTLAPFQKPKKKKIAAHPGMGAIRIEGGGVAFRVWAPNAHAVFVIGTFNNWDEEKHDLRREKGGTYYGVVPEAKEGDEYLFLLHVEDKELKRIDPWSRKVTHSAGNSVIWWPDASLPGPRFVPKPQNELIVYELHCGSFNVKEGQKLGGFASVIEKLPYLQDLGVNVIEVMPIAEFPGDFSWGYNPACPFAVTNTYGGPEAFQALVKAAHEHGIAVVLDVVYNHFGPGDLALWQYDGWNQNNLGGIYFYNDWKAKTPWGDTRPDYGRGQVRTYIRDNAMMWLNDFGVDGLRWDMCAFIRSTDGNGADPATALPDGWSLMQWVNADVKKAVPSAILIAEDLQNHDALVKAQEHGGAGFTIQWDAAFVHPVRATMIAHDDSDRSLDVIVSALMNSYDGDSFKRVVYSESHDEVANGKARLPTEIDAAHADGYFAKKRSILGAGLTLTTAGVPMLFQGQEFLEDEWFRDSVPVDWKKLDRFNGIFRAYRDLISLRLNKGGVTKGLTGAYTLAHHVNHTNKVIAFHRRYHGGPGDDVIVVMNLSHETFTDYCVGVPTEGLWRVRYNSDATHYSEDFKDQPAPDMEAVVEPLDGMTHHIVTGLAPYSMVILSRDNA
jgi:1,4-alpha-glucan branching enzyme